jgi:outer membrane protein
LSEIITQVIKNNPTQAVYQQQIKQAEYNYKASRGFLYPQISGSFGGTDYLHLSTTPIPGELIGKPGTTFNAQFGKKYNYNTGITISHDFFDWTSIFQSQIQLSNISLSQLQQDSYIQSLRDQAAKLYYSALIAQSALLTSKKDKILADSLVLLTKQRQQEGTTDLLSLNQSLISANSIIQNQAQSQQLYDQSIENLKILLGSDVTDELRLEENLNLDSLKQVTFTTLGNDKSLDVYKKQADIAVIQSRSQRSVAFPKLSLTDYIGGQQYRNDFGLSFNNTAWTPYRYIGVNITVPIFTGFTNSNKYKSALVQQNIAKIQYENARQQSGINDQLLFKNYNDYLQLVIASANNFKLYGDNVLLDQQKYKEGIISMDTYFKAFQDYLTAENNYLNNFSQLLSTRSTLLSRQ